MLARLGNLYAYLLGWPGLAKLHYKLFYLSARALGLLNYTSNRISGERHAMRLGLAGKSCPVVFDVGANKGEWLAEILRLCPAACIHAFEPQKILAEQIAVDYPGVVINNMGLGSEAGVLDLFDYADCPSSQHASLLEGVIDGVHHGRVKSQKVQVGTLDDYCAQHEIRLIDFLKIDVEGFELRVLQGAGRMLAEGRINVLQFEFNEMNLVGRMQMRDFFSCLSPMYSLYRLLPHGLFPMNPSETWLNEQFIFQNIVALKRK